MGQPVIRFGVFEVDLQAGELRKQGLRVNLQEKPLQVLAILLERPSKVVTREELQQRLWPDVNVDFEHSLSTAIKKLRDALDDAADNPRFIETRPGRGYRFIYPIEGLERRRWPQIRAWQAWLAAAALVALLAGLIAYWPSGREGPRREWMVKPLTSFVGMESVLTFSPDRSFVAFSSPMAGDMGIYVMASGGGEPVRLTDSPYDEVSPHWSPDGNHLAFFSDRGTGGAIYLIPPLGGPVRKLVDTHLPYLDRFTDGASSLGALPWSPDSKELLFSRLQPSGGLAVWKVDVQTSREIQLTHAPPGGDDLAATWSFDGETIVFTRRVGGRSGLWLLHAQGGEPRPVLEDDHSNFMPTWSPDNRRVVFTSNRGGAFNLWELEIESGQLTQVTAGPGADLWPVTSVAGGLAYMQFNHQIDLYALELGAPEQRLTAHKRSNFQARFSPDGKKIVYHSNRTGNYEIWLIDRETGAERRLTNHPAEDLGPDWSPDGREIVFLSNRGGQFELWVMNAEGGELRGIGGQSVLDPGLSFATKPPRWSPDGTTIGYVAPSEHGFALWTVTPQGEEVRPRLFGVHRFDWYGDSRRVIYTRTGEDGSTEMVTANLETEEERVLLRGPNVELNVAPNGRAVSYVYAASHFNMNLFMLLLIPPASPDGLPRAAGEPVQLTDGKGRWHVHSGGWSPDGKSLVYSHDLDEADFYIIENYR